MPIIKIVSGGQTGADQGGLDAAIHCELPHGGWCPKGRKCESGIIPEKYELKEMKSADYLARTEANVFDSDATVIFTDGQLKGGSRRTEEFARKHKKPCLHIDVSKAGREEAVGAVIDWLGRDCPDKCVLNVAGSRGSKSPLLAGIVKAWMIDVISEANAKLFYSIGEDAATEPDEGFYEHAGEEQGVRVRLEDNPGGNIPLYHPATIDEAVTTILEVLSDSAREMLCNISRDELGAVTHFGMGMAVRNGMIYQNRNQLALYADYQRLSGEDAAFTVDPDSVSGFIVLKAWERLQEKPF